MPGQQRCVGHQFGPVVVDGLSTHDRGRRVPVVEQRRRLREAMRAHELLAAEALGALRHEAQVTLAGNFADLAVIRHELSFVPAATMVPCTSPNPIRAEPFPPHHPRIVTLSPSARNVRVEPSARASGSEPRQVSSMRLPRAVRSGPDTVPDPYRSPGRNDAPLIVVCASCWAKVQYMSVKSVREIVVAFSSTSSSKGIAHGRTARRYSAGAGSWTGGSVKYGRSASSGTTHGEIDVANDLARNGPSG